MTSDARTVHEADEDGFHEIQLNGKQLVFLGMTTTLVSVVIFLCGVLVGRGVKPIEPVAEAASVTTAAPVADPPPSPEAPPPVPEATAAAATPAPVSNTKPATPAPVTARQGGRTPGQRAGPGQELSYYDALQKGTSKAGAAKGAAATAPIQKTPEPAKKASAPPAPAPAVAETSATPAPVVPDAAPAPAPAAATAAVTPASKSGAIAVQVAALTSRTDAEAIARRLSGKGYAAYVVSPAPGAKAVFKVRVGNYASTDEAERVSRRLKQEEKLQPWVIR